MNQSPPVSIYIVTYLNAEERCAVLRRTCEAALAQRYPDFEVVVSDNGGSHSAEDALRSIRDPRLKVYRNAINGGFTGNINLCLEHCTHDVIKPICDDDLIHPDFLALTVPLVDDETLVITGIEKYRIGKDPEGMAVAVDGSPETEMRAPGYRPDIWSLPYAPVPSATLFTRELFKSLGGYDAKTITSDWDFLIEAFLYRRIVHVNHVLCFVGVWAGSLTVEMEEKPYFFPFEMLYTEFRIFHCKNLADRDRRALLKKLYTQFFWQSLRPLKHPLEKAYHVGYLGYARRFFQLLRQDRKLFGARPNPSL